MGDLRPGRRLSRGFTLIELLFVVAIGAVMVGAAVPYIVVARQRFALNGATHDVAAAVQSAKLRALSTGRTMRVRFNCPVVGDFRVVELTGDAAIDGAGNRCDPTAYPYPDQNPGVAPDQDGPVQVLRGGVTFFQSTNFDITPTGRITPVAGAAPVTIIVTKSNATQTLTLSASGRVAFQ